jgi:hypothetical protein
MRMVRTICVFLSIFFICSAANATRERPLPWSLEVGLGYGRYLDMYRNDGNTVLYRLGVAKELMNIDWFHGGLELGAQSGDTARPRVSQTVLNQLGGLQIESTIKPLLDLLLTARVYPTCSRVFGQIKIGAAWRNWQFTRTTISDVSRVNPELQLGIGYDISRLFRLSLSYQGIYGQNGGLESSCATCSPRFWGNIPTQNSVILGMSILLDKGLAS